MALRPLFRFSQCLLQALELDELGRCLREDGGGLTG
jgi:hypothetical protein